MRSWLRLSAVPVAAAGVLLINSLNAAAFTSGTTGYDISYLQCGTTYPSGAFGIIGVDSGWPFISALHPGNPCLADEVAHTSTGQLYVNTGFDPSYTDANHTTADCAAKSASISGTSSQRAAWAAGCSEAQKDLAYVASVGLSNPTGWWLDVETSNSWCGQHGTHCRDLSLNQYTIQGLIDTFTSSSTGTIGVYSTRYQWTAIVGHRSVSGVAADWYATGQASNAGVSAYCGSSYSFTGAPVTLAQYVSGVDRDYAC